LTLGVRLVDDPHQARTFAGRRSLQHLQVPSELPKAKIGRRPMNLWMASGSDRRCASRRPK